jgi:hypothetical protein
MELKNKPTKEQVRHYLGERQALRCPPPPIDDIRRQLGWGQVQTLAAEDRQPADEPRAGMAGD